MIDRGNININNEFEEIESEIYNSNNKPNTNNFNNKEVNVIDEINFSILPEELFFLKKFLNVKNYFKLF